MKRERGIAAKMKRVSLSMENALRKRQVVCFSWQHKIYEGEWWT